MDGRYRNMDGQYDAIDEVIKYIHQNIHEPLTLSRLSNYVAYSPYHFSRLFKERVGLSPHYYISSIRLEKAKDMLLHTNLSVRDIGMEIGQQSLGTFTTRFTQRVGISPSQFRRSTIVADEHFHSLKKLNNWADSDSVDYHFNKVEGTVKADAPFQGIILIGLFHKPIPEGLPLYGTLLSSLGNFCFKDVKPGTYYLMATAISWEMQATDILLPYTSLRARAESPVLVSSDSYMFHLDLTLRHPRLGDPPILISLPLLMHKFLNQVFLEFTNSGEK